MYKWERRLSDAAYALTNCASTYFEPELFRRNVNQFLTVSRTVTFLIAKDKASIPEFDKWHDENIVKYWGGDSVMKWAKDSRNFIEKEGDLELYSSLSVSLIYSYFSEEDISLELGSAEFLSAGVKKLIRVAEKHLPNSISYASAVKIDRRWVANTLPDHELFQALIYVYSRIYTACEKLAAYLGGRLSKEVPSSDMLGEVDVNGLRCKYVKFSDRDSYSVKSRRLLRDEAIEKPEWLSAINKDLSTFDLYADFAEKVFNKFGNHLSMVFLFSKEGHVVQHTSFVPADQVDKFIFWRGLAEQIVYLRAHSLIFISEIWYRRLNRSLDVPIHQLEIIGEALQIYEIKKGGDYRLRNWNIERKSDEVILKKEKDIVLNLDRDNVLDSHCLPSFLTPVKNAFARVHDK
ncbi:hypothetical protein Undi14_07970 [Undibacterium sp. 14-3-2]|uniref:hypothetical protein n=1 Tax=Undibacterium sp. 14-3-2 TaxID=2800129 RepID=UPI001905FBA3|nr:hypothetical protein [Undibacterium sp. 14-3-2]MBK1889972.1 hypothetical protein [Undibacterium sp. 14-3-2]